MKQKLPEHVIAEIDAIMAHPGGPVGRMRDREREMGHMLVAPGSYLPFIFPKEDWEDECVVSVAGKEVRLVIITAIRPCSGAFRRLVEHIQSAGLTPVVCAPVGPTMPFVMQKWRWVKTDRGGWETCDEWRPPT